MADRPRDHDWWLASDGKWYPPDLAPGSYTPLTADAGSPTAIPRRLTLVVSIALAVAAGVLAGAAYVGLRYAAALGKFSGSLSDIESASLEEVELTWAGWTAAALFLLVITGVLVIVWTSATSKALDNRGPEHRRWRGGWTVGAWFVPFANLVLPKLVFNEIERIAIVPYQGGPVGDAWRAQERSQLGDLWWLLWVGGVVPSQVIQIVLGDPTGDVGRMAVLVTISSFTYALFAAAGIALAFLLRRIERSSRSAAAVAK